MEKLELEKLIGKKSFFDGGTCLLEQLDYESGIDDFDNYLKDHSKGTIHFDSLTKGFQIDMVKAFSKHSFGVSFTEIRRVVLNNNEQIIIELNNGAEYLFNVCVPSNDEVVWFFDGNKNIDFYEEEISLIQDLRAGSDKVTDVNLEPPPLNNLKFLTDEEKWRTVRWGLIIFIVFHILFEFIIGNVKFAGVAVIINYFVSAWIIKRDIRTDKSFNRSLGYGLLISIIVFTGRIILGLLFARI